MLFKYFFKIIIFLFISFQFMPSNYASPNSKKHISEILDYSSEILLTAWNKDDYLKKIYPPQVILLDKNAEIFGGCKSRTNKEIRKLTGSGYCGSTNTIYLLDDELNFFYEYLKKYGILLVLAHEWGHALQHAYLSKLLIPKKELQADCIAGELLRSFDKHIKKEDIHKLSRMAQVLGGKDHGTGEQRKKALLTGLGELEGDCLNLESYL